MIKTLQEICIKTPTRDPFKIVEELGVPYSPILFPGHFYSLSISLPIVVNPDMLPINEHEYKQNTLDKAYFTNKPYYDTMPIGMALRISNDNYVSILNLKVLPPTYRNMILESYYQMMGIGNELITKYYNDTLTESDLSFIERLKVSTYINPFMSVTQDFINSIVGSNIGFAVNIYEINTIKNVRLLDWNALPYLYKMNISNKGMVFNGSVGGLSSIQSIFESKFTPV
jgi:hypothetical protein